MGPSALAVLQEALALPVEDRAALAEKLLESLESQDQIEVDKAWAVEVERRIAAYAQGELGAIPGMKASDLGGSSRRVAEGE